MIELLFEFLFQVIFEVILQLVGELLVEVGLRSLAEPFRQREVRYPVLAFIGYALLGLIAGALSLIFLPHAFVRSAKLHGISLLISPVIAGAVMSLMGVWRRMRGESLLRLDSSGYGFIFASGMALVRLLFTS